MLGVVATLGLVVMAGSSLALNALGYAESFESPDWAVNDPVITKAGEFWYLVGDESKVIASNMTGAVTATIDFPITPDFPIPDADHDQILELNTMGGVLTNAFSMSDGDAAKVFVDMMISFVPSETPPVALTNGTDTGNQMALLLNADGKLMALHGGADGTERTYATYTNNVLPNHWYRLTITMDYASGDDPGFEDSDFFQVKLNEKALGTSVGYEVPDDGLPAGTGGTWLRAANKGVVNEDKISSVCFQGTGFIDDLVVTDSDPFDTTPTVFYYIYTVVGANGGIDKLATEQVAAGGSLTIVYTANDWYRIDALMTNALGQVLAEDVDAAGDPTYSQTFTNVQQDYSNEVSFVAATDGQTAVTVPNSYASTYYATEAAAAADGNIETDYLLGVNPTGTYDIELAVVSITKSGTTVTVVVELTDNDVPLATTINGEVVLFGRDTMGAFAPADRIASTALENVTFTGGQATLTFLNADKAFLKAVIEPVP